MKVKSLLEHYNKETLYYRQAHQQKALQDWVFQDSKQNQDPTKAFYLGLINGLMWSDDFIGFLDRVIDENQFISKD